MTSLLERLRSLSEQATPRPWTQGTDTTPDGWTDIGPVILADDVVLFDASPVDGAIVLRDEDAALIVAAVNALPRLLAVVEAAATVHYPLDEGHHVCACRNEDNCNEPCPELAALAALEEEEEWAKLEWSS